MNIDYNSMEKGNTSIIVNHSDETMKVITTENILINALNTLCVADPGKYRLEETHANHQKQVCCSVYTTPCFDRIMREEQVNALYPEERILYFSTHMHFKDESDTRYDDFLTATVNE